MAMKFHRLVTEQLAVKLEAEFEAYVAETEMSEREKVALQEWVQEGHGVHESPLKIWIGPEADKDFLEYMREMVETKRLVDAEECDYEDELLCQWDPWMDDMIYIRAL